MKKIEAIIKPLKLSAVKESLHEIGLSGMTILDVKGFGRQRGQDSGLEKNSAYNDEFHAKIKIELIVEDEIVKKAGIVDKKLLNLAGKTSLLGLAALIKGSQFFIGLDSVASHIAASVDKESITLFGPSNPVNWKPWSDKARIITQENLSYIEVKDVMSLVDEMPVE